MLDRRWKGLLEMLFVRYAELCSSTTGETVAAWAVSPHRRTRYSPALGAIARERLTTMLLAVPGLRDAS